MSKKDDGKPMPGTVSKTRLRLSGPETSAAEDLALAEVAKQIEADRKAIDAGRWLTEAIAQRVAELLRAQFESWQPPDRRLLSIEAAAVYMCRTPAAIRHMVAGEVLQAVRIDNRVMLDVHDLDLLIKSAKT